MEKFRRKRSTMTTVTDRIPTDSFSSKERVFRGGNRRVRRNLHNSASESSSCSSGNVDDSFADECNLKPSKQAFGASVKNLLAKEMTGKFEYKRRSPSIIAKLMGLDGLPPEQTTHRRQRKPSENFSNRFSFLKKAQRTCTFYDSQYSRRNSEQKYKDVFEVWETPKVESSSFSSHTSEKLKVDEAEMAFIRQKFLDAKRLSTDENFQHSKELHDALEILETNKDLLLKFLQQPDSLFVHHLKDLQVSRPHYNCRSIKSTESTDIHKYEKTEDFGSKPKRENLHKSHGKSHQKKKHCDGSFCRCESNNAGGNSMIEGKDEVTIQPTKIVVLKPNIGKAKNAADIALQPCSSRDFHSYCRKHIELSGKDGNFELSGERKMSSDMHFCRRNYRESREIAKVITRQMRSSMSANSTNLSLFGLEKCPMEENSKSANELNIGVVSSSHSINLLNRNGPSSSRSKESRVSWEAKKRLSDRWKMTHNSLEMEIVNKGSTLADMLASHDRESVAPLSGGGIRGDGFCKKFSNDDDPSELVEPLGISSRDGWKDECIGKLTRSRSLPSSTTALRIPKTRHIPDARYADRYLVRKEVLKHEWKEMVEGKFVAREGSVHRNSKMRHQKSHSYELSAIENHDNTFEAHTIENQVQINSRENEAHEKDLLIFETSPCFAKDKSSDPKTMVDKSLGELDDLVHCKIFQHQPSEPSKDNSFQLHRGHESETVIVLKESNQPSPVSVLDQPFTDDLSSCSDYFESLSADLHGLRMQLQLLKSESEAYAGGPPILSWSDEDVEEDLTGFFDVHKLQSGETWKITYLTDVLNHSALNDTDLDMFIATWHSPDCPINPSFFKELEKKWSDQAQKKYERRLLFDRINTGILELYQQFTAPRPWVRQMHTRQLECRWIEGGLHDDLCKLLANQEKEVKKDSVGRELGRENEWLNFVEVVDAIGREIERSLMDDLVAEVE